MRPQVSASAAMLDPAEGRVCCQVSMAAGRAGAAAARREEREMAAHQKRVAKEKGRKRAALAEADRGALATPCPVMEVPWLKLPALVQTLCQCQSSIVMKCRMRCDSGSIGHLFADHEF